MKKLIITIASLLYMVAGAGVVTVSDPGQLPSGKFILTGYTANFIHIDLTTSDASDQTVYLTIEQNGAASDMDLSAILVSENYSLNTSISNKLTGMQTILGPFVVKSGQTNGVVITAKINSLKTTNSSPVTVGLNLTSVSNSIPGMIQGVLPIQGTTYVVSVVDTNSQEVIEGKFTWIQVFWNWSGSPLDTNGMHFDLLYVGVKADPLRTYDVQYTEDMISWQTLASGYFTGDAGTFSVAVFMHLPPHCYYRLKSSP